MLETVPIAALLVSVASLWLAYRAYRHGVGAQRAEREVRGLLFDLDETGFRRLNALAKRGVPEAQFHAGRMYATGRFFAPNHFIQRDDVRAYSLLYRAACAGHEEAASFMREKGLAKGKSAVQMARERQLHRIIERLKLWPMVAFVFGITASTLYRSTTDPLVEQWWKSERGESYEFTLASVAVAVVLVLVRSFLDR